MKIRAKRHLYFGTFQVLALKSQEFDIKKEVPQNIIARLKQKEEHPFLQAYVICHEGEFTPEIVGEKSRPIIWSEEAVLTMGEISSIGKKLFYGHDTREVMGEIIYNTFKSIDGKQCYIIVAHHSVDKVEKASKCDICSQEAEWETIEFDGKLYADKISALFGVAIQQSTNDKPAFSGATKIAQVYANEAKKPEEKKPMTVAEVLQGIKDLNIQPYQAFDLERIKNDPVLGKQIPDVEPLKTQLAEKDEKIKALTESSKDLETKFAKNTAKERLDKLVNDKNCTDEQKKFIAKQYDTFGAEDYTDDGLTSFVDKTLTIYKNAVSVTEPEIKPPAKKVDEEGDDYLDDNFDPDEILGG